MTQLAPTRPRQERRAPATGRLATLQQDRVVLLAVLTVALVVLFAVLGATGVLSARFDLSYMLSSLMSLVPVALLALAQMFVILSGRSGIDLSVGGMVSLGGMVFGFLVGPAQLPVALAALVAVLAGAVMGALNGWLVAYVGFPPLIATLSTSYVFGAVAILSNDGAPVSGPEVAATNSLTSSLHLGGNLYLPWHVLTILLPCVVLCWFALARTRWGRALYAVGTNDVAARYATLPVRRVRASAYLASGVLCGVAAVVNVAQFASARPDAGTAGTGMTLPAITVAVLGGVAVTGGVGRVGGTVMAALLVTWLNAALLITFTGSAGPRAQLLALGVLLVGAVALNEIGKRRSLRARSAPAAPVLPGGDGPRP